MGNGSVINSVFVDFVVILILILGISRFTTPLGARIGNSIAAFALACAFVLVIVRHGIHDPVVVILSLAAGGAVGYALAMVVNMIQIPAMIAFQHGAGGVAAFLIAFVELSGGGTSLALMNEISGLLGLAIGAGTFSGSMIASAKLANKMRQTPQVIPFHTPIALLLFALMALLGASSLFLPVDVTVYSYLALIVLSIAFGVIIAIRVGGADMPVLISFLNATAGLAAAFCGLTIGNQLLIACGATVTASGSILTHVMCKAMNRSLLRIFIPKPLMTVAPATMPAGAAGQPSSGDRKPDEDGEKGVDILKAAIDAALAAKKVVIVPGYGMALAQAQSEVAAFAKHLQSMGKEVKFAIHPVAGRMPGHMNVLLAEAEVEYDMLHEMDNINDEFKDTDLALIVGACDVVNPAAIHVEGTPISGMPILRADEARNVICCNFDEKPGYSGVQNPLYGLDKTLMLLGDAKTTVRQLNEGLAQPMKDAAVPTNDASPVSGASDDGVAKAAELLKRARRVIVVPGYGMALAQAQFKVAELARTLEKAGASVKFAIHPVAGRMPGHMNVLLAEAEVEYDKLMEMDAINPEFREADVALVVGASDVINPAAISVEGTPISGMPILSVHEAQHIIVCNLDDRPGYSGVDNPIYKDAKTICIFGDAKETIAKIIDALQK